MQETASPRFAFVSANETPWGGSEELWARAALALVEAGAEVHIAKPNLEKRHAPLWAMRERGIPMTDLLGLGPVPRRIVGFLNFVARPAMFFFQLVRLWFFLWRRKPDLVVLSQGGSWDGFFMAPVLQRFGIPYVLICQKASDLYWPPDHLQERVRRFIRGARHVYFVSEHNRTLLEEQIGERLASASVVRNPFLVDYDHTVPWPESDDPVRFACVGRLYPMEKGQDILLRVLAQEKWQERNVAVSFYGDGNSKVGLRRMAGLLGCANVEFCGHVADIEGIWREHHALILPSRAEGLPLVLVETMLAGRVAIVSKAGGSAEVVDDGKTAFLMHGYDEEGLDEAMERAWQARASWQQIGQDAAQHIRTQVPRDPALALAQDLSRLLPAAGMMELEASIAS